jgi:hypothetical protein
MPVRVAVAQHVKLATRETTTDRYPDITCVANDLAVA